MNGISLPPSPDDLFSSTTDPADMSRSANRWLHLYGYLTLNTIAMVIEHPHGVARVRTNDEPCSLARRSDYHCKFPDPCFTDGSRQAAKTQGDSETNDSTKGARVDRNRSTF